MKIEEGNDIGLKSYLVNGTEIKNDHDNHNNKFIYSKRILCELIKSENEEDPNYLLMNLSNKLDLLIDLILNKHENKIHHIQQFLCYIVEINSDLIKVIPEYEKSTNDINLRFIMPAKNLYNYALEIYFSIHDLYGVKDLF